MIRSPEAHYHSQCVGGLLWRLSNEFEKYLDVLTFFHDALRAVCRNGSTITEIGLGSNVSLATVLLRGSYGVKRYTAVEKDQLILEWVCGQNFHILSDPRLEFVPDCFLRWQPAALQDVILSKFVLHHFPDELRVWYQAIYDRLASGGRYLTLDQAEPRWPDSSLAATESILESALATWDLQDRRFCLEFMGWDELEERGWNFGEPRSKDEVIADAWRATTARLKPYRDETIRHLYEDAKKHVPVDQHISLLEEIGFTVQVLSEYRLHYVLVATK